MSNINSISVINEQVILEIKSREKYSSQQIAIKIGEKYEIAFNSPQDKWYDLGIPSTAQGYENISINLFNLKMRVLDAKCFALCGCFDEDDETAFLIGLRKTIEVKNDKILSFFANDVKGFYWNNFGKLKVKITRTL